MQQVQHPGAGARLGRSRLGLWEEGLAEVPLLPLFLKLTLPCPASGRWQRCAQSGLRRRSMCHN